MSIEPEYLTPSETARIFGVSTKTVNRWAKAGKIAYIRTVGGHMRYQSRSVQLAMLQNLEHRTEDRQI